VKQDADQQLVAAKERLAVATAAADSTEGFVVASNSSAASGAKSQVERICKPMLMSMDLPEPLGPNLFILGEPVLRKYYTVLDADSNRIGFGLAKHTAEASSETSQKAEQATSVSAGAP
jgi:hypothetical protein